jgi:hypothetical protein
MTDKDAWIRELERRQDNIDPIRRIPNSALFQGTLINGNLRLNGVQRAGALFFGIIALAEAIAALVNAISEFRAGRLPGFGFLIFFPFLSWAGWRVTKNAIINDPEKAWRKKLNLPS